MDGDTLLRALFALISVLALIGIIAMIAKRLGLAGAISASPLQKKARLRISESLALTPKQRLVLVKRDGVEHLLFLGPDGASVVETGIKLDVPEGEEADKEETSDEPQNILAFAPPKRLLKMLQAKS